MWSLQASCLPSVKLPTFSNTAWQMWHSLLPGVHSFCVFAFLKSLAKVWEAAVSPLGGLQSAAHRQVSTACWTRIRASSAKGLDQAERGQALDVRLKVSVRILDPYLFLSPGGGGAPPTWRQEASFCRFVPFFGDFWPFQVAL